MPSIYMIGRDELLRKHIIQNGDELININDIKGKLVFRMQIRDF